MMAWALYEADNPYLTPYLDDFLFLMAPHMTSGMNILAIARCVFADLGIPVADHKTDGPACIVTFLGICIDTHSG